MRAVTTVKQTSKQIRSLGTSILQLRFWQQLWLLLITLLGAGTAVADAQLMVSPTRVVFEAKTRTTEITLINAGTSTGTFRIAFERKQMTEEGAYRDVGENESGMFADPYIRFSPRQVTLAPGQSQTVRLMLRKPSDLAEGEYRSHMLFQSIPDASATDIAQQVQEDKQGVTVRLIPILGISIPVIVRHGKLEASAVLSQLAFHPATEKSAPAISINFGRSGTQSVYGDLLVKFRPKGQEYLVGMAKGVAVFTPNTHRKFTLRLQPPEGVALRDGELLVEYRQPESEGGKLLAASQTSIPTNN